MCDDVVMPGIFSRMRLRLAKTEPISNQPSTQAVTSQSIQAPLNPSNHGPMIQNAQSGAGVLSIRSQQAQAETLDAQIGKIASPKDIRAVWNMCREIHPEKSNKSSSHFGTMSSQQKVLSPRRSPSEMQTSMRTGSTNRFTISTRNILGHRGRIPKRLSMIWSNNWTISKT